LTTLLAAFAAAAFAPVYEDVVRVDRVTGSIKRQTQWAFGAQAKPQVAPSPLERWLVARGKPVRHDWQYTSGTSRSILGSSMSYACGHMPPIGDFPEIPMAFFVCGSSDEEIDAFLTTMRHGTEADQQLAVDAAVAKASEIMDAHPEWLAERSPVAAWLED
jgi:hypothetical protein